MDYLNTKEYESAAAKVKNINTRIRFLQKQSTAVQKRYDRISDEFRDVIDRKYHVSKSTPITFSNFVYSKPEGIEYTKQRDRYQKDINRIKKLIGDFKTTLIRDEAPE